MDRKLPYLVSDCRFQNSQLQKLLTFLGKEKSGLRGNTLQKDISILLLDMNTEIVTGPKEFPANTFRRNGKKQSNWLRFFSLVTEGIH